MIVVDGLDLGFIIFNFQLKVTLVITTSVERRHDKAVFNLLFEFFVVISD